MCGYVQNSVSPMALPAATGAHQRGTWGWGFALEGFASRDLTLKVPLLVVQVLKLEMKYIDLMASFSCATPGFSRSEVGGPMQTAEVRQVGVEQLLLLGDRREGLGGKWTVPSVSNRIGNDAPESKGLLAGGTRNFEDRSKRRVSDVRVDGHDALSSKFQAPEPDDS